MTCSSVVKIRAKRRIGDCVILEAVIQRGSVKKVFLEISQNSQENICVGVSFLKKLQAEACNLINKETLALVPSCKFCKIFKNTFYYRTPAVVASVIFLLLFQPKMTLFIYLLIKQKGELNTRFYGIEIGTA